MIKGERFTVVVIIINNIIIVVIKGPDNFVETTVTILKVC